MEKVTYYRTETEADYWDLADYLGIRNGKVKTDNFLRQMWEKHGTNTCVKVIEHDDGEITWEVELYKSVEMRGEIVIRHQRNDVKVYHVETQEDYDDLINKLKKDGYTWVVDGNAEMESALWSVYASGTYIAIHEHDKMIRYGAIGHLKTMHPNEPIIKYKTDETDKAKELQKYREQIAKKKEELSNQQRQDNHKLFNEIITDLEQTYIAKNKDYGNSFEESLDEFGEIAGLVRIGDKFNRAKNLSENKANVIDESKIDTYLDMANYCIMQAMWLMKSKL